MYARIITHTDQTLEQEQLKSTEKEICSCGKLTCLTQSDLAEKMEECDVLKEEVSSLVSECNILKFEIEKSEADGESEKKRQAECRAMMNKHTAKLRELERKLPLQKELEYLLSHMEELKEHRMSPKFVCQLCLYFFQPIIPWELWYVDSFIVP